MWKFRQGLAVGLVLLALACSARPEQGAGGKVRVFVSIAPQAWLVERLGGGRVSVEVMVRPGQSAETYQPTPRQMAALGEANLYFLVRLPFEDAWREKLTQANPRLKLVDSTAGIPRRRIESHHRDEAPPAGEAAAHEDETAHAHEGLDDPHVWLDPIAAKRLAANMARALTEADPPGRATYAANLKVIEADLDQADREIRQTLAGLHDRRLMIYHPSLGYFADRYQLKQIPIQIEGRDPTARNLAELINAARRDGIRVIFVQQQFSTRSAETVAKAIGGRVEPVDDLSRDYLNNLRQIARTIATADRERQKP